MCGMFSQIMKLNRLRMDPIEYDRRRQEAIRHLKFAFQVYQLQAEAGRYFAHEHPDTADCWDLDFIKDFILKYDVGMATMDQCQYGLRVEGGLLFKTWNAIFDPKHVRPELDHGQVFAALQIRNRPCS